MKPTPPKKQAAHQTKAKQQASHTMIWIKKQIPCYFIHSSKSMLIGGEKNNKEF